MAMNAGLIVRRNFYHCERTSTAKMAGEGLEPLKIVRWQRDLPACISVPWGRRKSESSGGFDFLEYRIDRVK